MLKSALCAIAFFAIPLAYAADTGKRSITDKDLYSFRWIADAQISPDGSRVVYTLVNVAPKHDDYETALWMIPVSGGSPRQLTAGPHDSAARWSPDGKSVAFVRVAEREGKSSGPQIYLLSMDGGDARQLTDVPKGAGVPYWAPDGRTIAFSSATLAKDFEKPAGVEPESDVRVITRAEYRRNGGGYPDTARPSHIWTIATSGRMPARANQITSGDFDEDEITWSPDSSKIYFISDRTKESYYAPPQNALYSVAMAGGSIVKITGIDGAISALAIGPDGRRVAFTGEINAGDGVVVRSYSQPDLFVANLEPGSVAKNLTAAYDFDVAGSVGGDQAPPRGASQSRPWWTADGTSIVVMCGEQGRTNLKRISADSGKVELVDRRRLRSLLVYRERQIVRKQRC